VVKTEIVEEEEKIRIEKTIPEFERKLGQYLNSFNKFILEAVEHIKRSPYPYDANAPLSQARAVLKGILEMAKETKLLEDRLVKLTKTEKKLLKKEQKTA